MVSPRGEQKWPLRDSAAPTPGSDGAGGVGVYPTWSLSTFKVAKKGEIFNESLCFRLFWKHSVTLNLPPSM